MINNRVRSIFGIAWTSMFFSGLAVGTLFIIKIKIVLVIFVDTIKDGYSILSIHSLIGTFLIRFLGVNFMFILAIVLGSRKSKLPLSEATNRIVAKVRIVNISVTEVLLKKFSFTEQASSVSGERTFQRPQSKRRGAYVDMVRFKDLADGDVQIEIKIPKILGLLDLGFGAHFILDEFRKNGAVQLIE